MRKAVMYMTFTILLIPFGICLLMAWNHLVSFENDRISEETTRIRGMGPSGATAATKTGPSVAIFYAGMVDNAWNEFVAVFLAKSHEYFIRIAL
jgi:hypothetical protein